MKLFFLFLSDKLLRPYVVQTIVQDGIKNNSYNVIDNYYLSCYSLNKKATVKYIIN